MKKMVSLLLAVLLTVSLSVSAIAVSNGNLENFTTKNVYYPNQFKDVPSTSWCHDNVQQVYELGLMLGNSATTFNPTGYVTEAQALVIAARIHKIYTTGNDDFSEIKQEMANLEPQILEWCNYDTSNPGYKEFYEAWYSPYVYYLCCHTGDDYAYPIYPFLGAVPDDAPFIDGKNPLSRERFAYYMAYALPESEFQQINTVEKDAIPDMAYEQSPEVYQLYRSGVIIGSDGIGTFNPDSNVTRGAVAAIVTRIVNPALRQGITLKRGESLEDGFIIDQDMVTVSDTNLKIQKNSTVSVTVAYNEANYPDGITLNVEYDSNVVEIEWGSWNGLTTTLTVIPVANGTATIKVSILEEPTEYQDISITVYGQSYDAYPEPVPGNSFDGERDSANEEYIGLARDGYYLLY